MNVVTVLGRTTADVELRKTNSNKSVASFTLAVRRNHSKDNTDFLDCIAWDKTAETISRYVRKGSMIAIQGSIQTRMYEDKNGNKRKITEIVANNVSFCGGKNESNTGSIDVPPPTDAEYRDIPETDEELPF
jgi:single-strand DNA-binding protein